MELKDEADGLITELGEAARRIAGDVAAVVEDTPRRGRAPVHLPGGRAPVQLARHASGDGRPQQAPGAELDGQREHRGQRLV